MDLTIVVPTYNERENLQPLVERIFSVFRKNKIKGEIIIVDDNSPDGTALIAEKLRKKNKNLKIIKRKGKLGLSSAVLEGFKRANGNILSVIDADLSHPPEKIPLLFNEIKTGADFVIGSRYIKGGRIEGWGLYRKLVSKVGTTLARIFTKVKDPMSGFFMIKKECLEEIDFNPKGFKICLEFLIKAKYKNVKEVPITFTNRKEGKSKVSFKEYYFLLRNLVGYLFYKKRSLGQFIKFSIVGGVGTLINIAILYILTEFFNIYYLISAIFAFIVALTNNFILNKIWTFEEKLKEGALRKYIKFFTISVIALTVNLSFLYIFVEYFKIWYIFAQFLAILITLIINFSGNKLWTFIK